MYSTRMGFEPTRAEHIGLAVQRLNHSATSSLIEKVALFQSKYTGLLRRHLHRRCDGDRAKSAAQLELFAGAVRSLREMSDIMVNRTIKVTENWPNLEDMI